MKNKIVSYTVTVVLYFGIIPGVLTAVGWWVDTMFGFPHYGGFHQLAGGMIMTLGIGLVAWCWCLLCKVGKGHPQEILKDESTPPPRELVCVGPYRWVRNPMCWGFTFYIAGLGVFIGSYGGAILSPLLYLGGGSMYFLLVEEKKLLFRFPNQYRAYLRQTPMLTPAFFDLLLQKLKARKEEAREKF